MWTVELKITLFLKMIPPFSHWLVLLCILQPPLTRSQDSLSRSICVLSHDFRSFFKVRIAEENIRTLKKDLK